MSELKISNFQLVVKKAPQQMIDCVDNKVSKFIAMYFSRYIFEAMKKQTINASILSELTHLGLKRLDRTLNLNKAILELLNILSNRLSYLMDLGKSCTVIATRG